MKSFEYASPKDLDTAIGLLESHFGDTELLAGGTDLLTSLKQGLVAPKRLVNLKSIASLNGIEAASDTIRVGATTPLVDVLEDERIKKEFPSLVRAIEGIGSPQIINMGTIAGDLCQRPRCWYYRQGFGLLGELDGRSLIPNGDNRYHAIFGNEGPAYFVCPSILAPPLMALGATLNIAGPNSKSRLVPVADFFRIPKTADERENILAANEVITRISIPIRGLRNASYEVKQRQGLDWPLVAAAIAFGGNRADDKPQIVLGHVAPKPWAVPEAAALLTGNTQDAALAARVGEAAAKGANPLSRNAYKVQLVKTAVKRAILAAADNVKG
jgi:xanthine dehydrogenase YagS FAD-binding subunit